MDGHGTSPLGRCEGIPDPSEVFSLGKLSVFSISYNLIVRSPNRHGFRGAHERGGISGEDGLGLDFTLYMLYKFIFGIVTLPKDTIRRTGGYDVSKMDEYDSGDSIGFFCDGSYNQLRKGQL